MPKNLKLLGFLVFIVCLAETIFVPAAGELAYAGPGTLTGPKCPPNC